MIEQDLSLLQDEEWHWRCILIPPHVGNNNKEQIQYQPEEAQHFTFLGDMIPESSF